jgi:xylan 1,4-beta-xylosidase
LKRHDPQLKIGGPAVGFSGELKNGIFSPSSFVVTFLELCRRESLALDFFSWHCYTDDPAELTRRSKAIRSLLNSHGFTKTESHLNEWNYLPQKSWKPLSKSALPETRQKFYAEMSGAGGAAFIACALIELQDAPVEICNLFHGELGGFGLFNENAVPYHNYYALRAFNQIARSGKRVTVSGTIPGKLAALATMNPQRKEAFVLLANYRSDADRISINLDNLPWAAPAVAEVALLNEKSAWTTNSVRVSGSHLQIELNAPTVALIRLRP